MQHLLMGASEVFLSAGQMEFFVDQAPESMRSLGNALYISTLGLGNFINQWCFDHCCHDEAHMELKQWVAWK